jgi:hypothetical protein
MLTPLDAAHAAMTGAADDDAARLRYYARLAATELVLLLEAEPEGATLTPRVFALATGPVVLVFDGEERLAAFAGGPAPYAALPGREIARQLAGQGLGLGVNLGVAESACLLPPEALGWLAATLGRPPEVTEARPATFRAPDDLPAALLAALAERLGQAGGLAAAAVLAGVDYADGRRGHLLAFLEARPGAEAALARAAGEALLFAGTGAGAIDVAFLAAADPAAAAIRRAGLSLDLTEPAAPAASRPPGPATPPRLR